MSITCTFPGKFGDLLWALPTVRAISESAGEPVNLILSNYLRPIVPLVERQPYIQHVTAYEPWRVEMTAPISPRTPPAEFHADHVIHLGYEGWPLLDLPHEILGIAEKQVPVRPETFSLRPWISPMPERLLTTCVVGFTDEYFELKYGLWSLLTRHKLSPELGQSWLSISGIEGSRWRTEGGHVAEGWLQAATAIGGARCVLACCSALHVLGVAMGRPTIVMEPNPQRHHPIFWPEAVRDRVIPVIGGDGKLTWDARHVFSEIVKFA